MVRSVDGMKLLREKYSGYFIPYNLPELFQGCEKLANSLPWARQFSRTNPVFHKIQYDLAEYASSEWYGELWGVFHINTLTSGISV